MRLKQEISVCHQADRRVDRVDGAQMRLKHFYEDEMLTEKEVDRVDGAQMRLKLLILLHMLMVGVCG